MPKNKTQFVEASVENFIDSLTNEQQKIDCYQLIKLMSETTGAEPRMYGTSIVGFGEYYYKYKSGHEGTAPLVGFSPRSSEFSLYVYTSLKEHEYLLEGLGKYKLAKACIYIKRFQDINEEKLSLLIQKTIEYLSDKYKRIH